MKIDPRSTQLLVMSERVYCALLVLYPEEFRREYRAHMTQVFRDVCREVYRQSGTGGLMHWWAATLFDLLQTVYAERRKVTATMSQDKFIQSSGWLFILGGIFFAASSISQLQPSSSYASGESNPLSLYALVPAMALIMLGLLGMLLRFKTKMNRFGKLALLTALIGAGIMSIGLLLTLAELGGFWNVFIGGWMIHMAGHTIFGGFATTSHLLPRWNFALLIGSALPLTVVVLGFSNQQTMGNWAAFAMLLLISIGWLLTGWAVNSQPTPSMQPIAST